MQPSQKAYALVQHFESCRLRSYQDSAGVWTIAWGHTKKVGPGMKVDEDEAYGMLMDDMTEAAYEVVKRVKVPLLQHQFDSLVSFVFNMGGAKFESSTLLKKINAEAPKASSELLRWNKAKDKRTGRMATLPGLTRRRKSEKELFDTGQLVFEFPRGEV